MFLKPSPIGRSQEGEPFSLQPMGIGLCPSTCGRAPAGSGEVDSSPQAALSWSLSLLPWKQPHRDRSLCALHVPQLPPQTQQSLPVSHLHSAPPDCPPQNSPSPLLKYSEALTWPRPLRQPSWASSTSGTLHSATQLDPREAQAHAVSSPLPSGFCQSLGMLAASWMWWAFLVWCSTGTLLCLPGTASPPLPGKADSSFRL